MDEVKHIDEIDLVIGLTGKQLAPRPYCRSCGWRKGGMDSWNSAACKCGHSAPTFRELFNSTTESGAQSAPYLAGYQRK